MVSLNNLDLKKNDSINKVKKKKKVVSSKAKKIYAKNLI
jgi:hypothetical protein